MSEAATSAPLPSAAALKTRVFISYARADMTFADRLAAALTARGYEVLIDRQSLPTLEDWRRELLVLISKVDTVVFIVSSRSITSSVCQWEVEQMALLDKRLAPVVLERVTDDRIPANVARINYLFFDPPNDFETQVDALSQALRTDINWWHEHTHFVSMAARWDRDGRPASQLLRHAAITAGQTWASLRPAKAQIPQIVFHFLDASIKLEAKTLRLARRRQKAIYALMLAAFAALFGVIFKEEIATSIFQNTTLRYNVATEFQPYVLSSDVERALRPGQVFRECAQNCPEMVVVPAGSFRMGWADHKSSLMSAEWPARTVTIAKPFAVSKFEVTWDEWEACVALRHCDGASTVDSSGFGKGRHPVINVSWAQAQRYVEWLSRSTDKQYRLLTEAEWEYAARAIIRADALHPDYPWGDFASRQYANYGTAYNCCTGHVEGRDKWHNTAPVGQFPPNAFGLHDMHGNVSEWVQDSFTVGYRGAPTDGSAWLEGGDERVYRGGSWLDTPDGIRSGYRGRMPPHLRSYTVGIRVARLLSVNTEQHAKQIADEQLTSNSISKPSTLEKRSDHAYQNAQRYHYGRAGAAKDYGRAQQLYQQAADSGNVDAMLELAFFYETGLGVPQDYAKARDWYEKAVESLPARAGASAMQKIGDFYWYGRGIKQDHVKAREWYEKAAERGSIYAEASLGQIYRDGSGAKQDYSKARLWFERAAWASSFAMTNLGDLYWHGRGVEQDYVKAREWYEKAAEHGSAYAMASLGQIYRDGLGVPQDYSKARIWFERGAELEYTFAITNLGDLYWYGRGVRQDHVKAREWYEKAAERGSAYAMASLGQIYRDGLGAARDYSTARAWFEKAAVMGNSFAMNNIGWFYERGFYFSQDYVKAREWYERAAQNGHALSHFNLARLLDEGKGGRVDPNAAASRLLSAAMAGEKDAISQLTTSLDYWSNDTRKALQKIFSDAGFYSDPIDGAWLPSSQGAAILYLNKNKK